MAMKTDQLQQNGGPVDGMKSIEWVMDYLSLSRGQIYKLLKTGELRHMKVGRVIRIPFNSVRQYTDRQTSLADLERPGQPAGDAGE
jgi:excisionase family DNA binding protein